MNYFVHNLSPFAFQFSEGFGVRWYGLAYAMGLLWGWWVLIRLANLGKIEMDAKKRAEFIFALLLGIIVGGRLGFMLLYDLGAFISNPFIFFEFQKGGMASHGGFVGVAVACFVFAKRNRAEFWKLTDLVCLMAPMGILLGRIANFINGELWGKISQVPWAVIFPASAPVGTPLSLIAPRHPSQLYEATLEGLLLLIYTQLRYRQNPKAGLLTAEFLGLYGIVRIIGEIFREPDADLILGLSRGSFYSLFAIALGIGLWIFFNKKTRKV